MQGWISLHRKIRRNPVFNNLELLRLWIICLTEATHKDYEQLVGNQVVKLLPGQFVTGRFDLHKMYNEGLSKQNAVTEYTVWRWLQTLEKLDFVSIKSSNKFSIVSVVKWAEYQNNEQQNEQQMSNKRATDEQQMSTNNNVNNNNNSNKLKPSSPRKKITYSEDDKYYLMAKYLHNKIIEHAAINKVSHLVENADFQNWADDFRKIIELDKRNTKELQAIIDFATSDAFWSVNILSPSKLRKQYVTLAAKTQWKPPIASSSGGNTKAQRNQQVLKNMMEEAQNEQSGSDQTTFDCYGSLPEHGANE